MFSVSPSIKKKSISCIYYCLLTITRRDWVTDDYRWLCKCLSLAPGYLVLKIGWLQKWQQRELLPCWLIHTFKRGELPVVRVHRGGRNTRGSNCKKRNQSDWEKKNNCNYFKRIAGENGSRGSWELSASGLLVGKEFTVRWEYYRRDTKGEKELDCLCGTHVMK